MCSLHIVLLAEDDAQVDMSVDAVSRCCSVPFRRDNATAVFRILAFETCSTSNELAISSSRSSSHASQAWRISRLKFLFKPLERGLFFLALLAAANGRA